MGTLAQRLRETRKEKGYSQTELASEIGASQGAIHQIEKGITKKSHRIPAIANVLGVTSSWLEYGEGIKDSKSAQLTEMQKNLLIKFRSLGDSDQETVIRYC